MKNIFIVIMTLFSITSQADERSFTCKSDDFNAKTVSGQSLNITVTSGIITQIKKNKGSWYSSGGVVVNPRILAKNKKEKIYDCDFHDDSGNGRLVVKNGTSIVSVYFSFVDDESGESSYELSCKKSNQ